MQSEKINTKNETQTCLHDIRKKVLLQSLFKQTELDLNAAESQRSNTATLATPLSSTLSSSDTCSYQRPVQSIDITSPQLTVLILLDLSSAFYTVDHDCLLRVLQNRFSVDSPALDWFQSYLSDRSQTFIASNNKSPGQPTTFTHSNVYSKCTFQPS